MFKDQNLKQEGGESSTNLQGQNVNIYNGITYQDAKEIALDVFKSNFLDLSRQAATIAKQRAEELTEEFLKKLQEKNPEGVEKINDPDVQFAIFSAQQEYARSGEKDLEEMLVDILIERIENDNHSLKKIVLNEALKVLPKITNQQLDILTLIFLIRDTSNRDIVDIETFGSYIINFIEPFLDSLTVQRANYKHLQFTGCCSTTSGFFESEVCAYFIHHYGKIFSKGFEGHSIDSIIQGYSQLSLLVIPSLHHSNLFQLNANNLQDLNLKMKSFEVDTTVLSKLHQLFEQSTMSYSEAEIFLVRLHPKIQILIDTWRDSEMHALNPTTVGTALAYINMKRKTNIQLNLDLWIK